MRRKVYSLQFIVYSISFFLMLLTVHCTLYTTTVFAQPVSSTQLINNAALYDAKVVSFEGEVIGDVMARGDFAWINVFDGQNAIGIWIASSLTREILYTGSYKAKGDWVEISGVFHRACPEHGGDLDIHAAALHKNNRGRLIKERFNLGNRNFSFVLLGVLALIWILTRLIRR